MRKCVHFANRHACIFARLIRLDQTVGNFHTERRQWAMLGTVDRRRLRQGRRLSCFSIPVMPAYPLSQRQ